MPKGTILRHKTTLVYFEYYGESERHWCDNEVMMLNKKTCQFEFFDASTYMNHFYVMDVPKK